MDVRWDYTSGVVQPSPDLSHEHPSRIILMSNRCKETGLYTDRSNKPTDFDKMKPHIKKPLLKKINQFFLSLF